MKKRVCLVRLAGYPYDMLVRREAIALRDYGFEVEVLCLRGRGQVATEIVDGVRVHRFPHRRTKGGIGSYLYSYAIFFVLVAVTLTARHLRRPYDFIQFNNMPEFLVFAGLIPRLMGAKIVLQMYEPTPELWATRLGFTEEDDIRQASTLQRTAIKLLRWVEQASLRYAHAACAVTQQLKENFVAHGANPDKITVVLNVPDPHLFEIEADGVGLDYQFASANEGFSLICHGAIEERYGHDTMLRAVASLRSSIPGLQLRITGTGSYCDEFLAQIESMGLQDHVQYLGFVPLDQLVAELRKADVGIVAQKSSVYSSLVHTGKMYDYLAFGKPVIASQLRAVQAYFDADSLCFFAPGDPDDLARAILELYQQPERRQALIGNALQLYERYRWEKQRELYWEVYARLDGQKGTTDL